MMRLWWAQIRSIIRLEMKKTFFAKRGLWTYVLALLPLLLFIGHAIETSHEQGRSYRLAQLGEKHLTYQDLLAIKTGMTKQEVNALLGRPPESFHWNEQKQSEETPSAVVAHEGHHYSDGINDLYLDLSDGKVDDIHIHEAYNLGEESIGCA